MQANVDKILAAATAAGVFNLVTDEIFDETDKYPVLVATDRIDRPNEVNSVQNVYFSTWEYEVHILVKKTDGFAVLESQTAAFLKNLFNGEWRLIEQNHYDASVLSGDEILANTMRLEFIGKQAYTI